MSQYTAGVTKDTPLRPERDLSYDSGRIDSDGSQRRISFGTHKGRTLDAGKVVIRENSRKRGA